MALRALECEANGIRVPPWEELIAAEAPEGCTFFYYRGKNVAWILNGSHTHPDMPPTPLSSQQVMEAAAIAFDDCEETIAERVGIKRTLSANPFRR